MISGLMQSQLLVGAADGIDEITSAFAGDRYEIIHGASTCWHGGLVTQYKVEAEFIAVDKALSKGTEECKFLVGVDGAEVVKNQFSIPIPSDGLHSRSTGRGRYGAELRWHDLQPTVTPIATHFV